MSSKTNNNIFKEVGHIVSFFEGVGKVQGLPNVALYEVLLNEQREPQGVVIGFDRNFVDVIFFDEKIDITQPLFRSKEIFSIKVSEGYLGRIVDGLGNPLDGMAKIEGEKRSVFSLSPPLLEREPVDRPLITGIKVIDATLPLGRGQRELIIGDRKLGKTTLALDVVLNQKNAQPPVYCIYVVCGQKITQLEKLVAILKEQNALLYTTVVAATADDSLACQYFAPFVGCTIGEYFRDQGKDVLVVYDDLSKHAKVYRDISLLLERPPGRETYPGDIFTLHATLLERAANLKRGSLTALPIIETQEGDITGFIPTNLISITDGQIYLERGLFQKGFLPAVNVGLSVSRIGSQAQPPLLKKVTGGLRLALSQRKELQKLTQLETAISQEAKKKIKRGELILEVLKQKPHQYVSWEEQVVLFYCVEEGLFDEIRKEEWEEYEELFLQMLRTKYLSLLRKLQKNILTQDLENEIKKIVFEFKKEFLRK